MRTLRQLLCLAIMATPSFLVSCGESLRPAERFAVLEIAPQLVPCTGVGPRQCMLVRERPASEWTLFYDHIDGFEFEPGYEYIVRVGIRSVDDPPANGSSVAYRLIAVLRKVPA